MRTLVLALGCAALWAGCSEDKKPGGAGGASGAGGTGNCVQETSKDAASAVKLPAGMAVSGMVCPLGDVDFFSIDVPAGQTLIDLNAGYPMSTTRVALSLALFAADGVAAIANGQAADTMPDDGTSSVTTTFKVPAAGTYMLAVRDAGDHARDDLNTYSLRATPAADPDTHEPNDTAADAKAPDGMPGWLSYLGDKDLFRISATAGTPLVNIVLENGMSARAVIRYKLLSAQGATIAEGTSNPGQMLNEQRALPGAGDYLIEITQEPGRAPDHRPEAAYRLSVLGLAEGDPNEGMMRNDTGATATPLGMPFAGATVVHPGKTGQVGSSGDRDFFRLDVGSGAPAIVEISASMVASTVPLAVDLVAVHDASSCTTDNDCEGIKQECGSDLDCELSHACLPEGAYGQCAKDMAGRPIPCRLCAGARLCVPGGAGMACAYTQYQMRDINGGADGATLKTAQPLFAAGPYYVVVHAYQDTAFEQGKDYSLSVTVAPEPDPGDQGMMRNNFYNPYPERLDDVRPNGMRARDIDMEIAAGMDVTGWLSYPSDSDWFSFAHPCPGMTCGLEWEFVQPGPSRVQAVFLMRDRLSERASDGIHESWTYSGATPVAMLAGPVTEVFGDGTGNCRECSLAKSNQGMGDPNFRFYVQVRDAHADDWDFSSAGQYKFRLRAKPMGCPSNCSFGPDVGGDSCYCFCPDTMSCPPLPDL